MAALAADGGGEAELGSGGCGGIVCQLSGCSDRLPGSFCVVGSALQVPEAGHGSGELRSGFVAACGATAGEGGVQAEPFGGEPGNGIGGDVAGKGNL